VYERSDAACSPGDGVARVGLLGVLVRTSGPSAPAAVGYGPCNGWSTVARGAQRLGLARLSAAADAKPAPLSISGSVACSGDGFPRLALSRTGAGGLLLFTCTCSEGRTFSRPWLKPGLARAAPLPCPHAVRRPSNGYRGQHMAARKRWPDRGVVTHPLCIANRGEVCVRCIPAPCPRFSALLTCSELQLSIVLLYRGGPQAIRAPCQGYTSATHSVSKNLYICIRDRVRQHSG